MNINIEILKGLLLLLGQATSLFGIIRIAKWCMGMQKVIHIRKQALARYKIFDELLYEAKHNRKYSVYYMHDSHIINLPQPEKLEEYCFLFEGNLMPIEKIFSKTVSQGYLHSAQDLYIQRLEDQRFSARVEYFCFCRKRVIRKKYSEVFNIVATLSMFNAKNKGEKFCIDGQLLTLQRRLMS